MGMLGSMVLLRWSYFTIISTDSKVQVSVGLKRVTLIDIQGDVLNIHSVFLNSTFNLTCSTVNITVNLTQTIYNLTLAVVNTTASFVNGSLVNETICHYAHLPKYVYFNVMNLTCNITDHVMNYTMCMVNQTVLEYFNMTVSPVLTALRNLKALSELKAEDIVKLLQPQSKL